LRVFNAEIKLGLKAAFPFLFWNTNDSFKKVNGLTGRKPQAASYKRTEKNLKFFFRSEHVANLNGLSEALARGQKLASSLQYI
jgi:hypothetical protein